MRGLVVAVAITALSVGFAKASPFAVTFDVFDEAGTVIDTQVRRFTSLEDAVATLNEDELERLSAEYDNASRADIRFDIRGLPATARLDTGSQSVRLEIPEIGIDRTFTADTREEALEIAEDFIRDNGDQINRRITEYLVANTASDPINGNPNSLVYDSAAAAFRVGTAPLPGPGLGLSASVVGGFYRPDSDEARLLSIPVQASWRFGNGMALIADATGTIMDAEGALSFWGSGGLGLAMPITDAWTVTPSLRAGFVGSYDLAISAFVYGGALSSRYEVVPGIDGPGLALIGSVGAWASETFAVEDFTVEYESLNVIARAGAEVWTRAGWDLAGVPARLSGQFSFAAVAGDDVFVSQYVEAGVALTLTPTGSMAVTVGATVTYGIDADFIGARIRLGASF